MITIVDYGMGNLGSVANMFKKIGATTEITGDLERIKNAEKILLPGVGAFDAAIKRIDEGGFRSVLNQKALEDKIPVLGICLGMQLLTRKSEEGELAGLGWIPADTLKFSFKREENLKVPHMGWNRVYEVNSSRIIQNMPEEPRFYFVHSYFVRADKDDNVLMRTHFGHDFDAVITNGSNIFGAQFHPEKSHKFGMKLFENFAKL
ncbi:imidazole glycerol phosphate synthase subunit HisH [Pedobacter nyackensis]|uniref:Imidazole glycerol phosphate synthase subunit HisH n=1 Tax=Pedobacter nyackensis TaxID=475255 RepID=A0A1W2C1W5_9SPHI|nr:imidazole glycerol phosphate synthase subunit HisH [Pedobacter nyackensis]SMC79081.1 imidazole glycerol phosphate synthase subunit hisH [Pedobacter nyackensis]